MRFGVEYTPEEPKWSGIGKPAGMLDGVRNLGCKIELFDLSARSLPVDKHFSCIV